MNGIWDSKSDAIKKGDNLRDVSQLMDKTRKDGEGFIHYVFICCFCFVWFSTKLWVAQKNVANSEYLSNVALFVAWILFKTLTCQCGKVEISRGSNGNGPVSF